jgi:hypothetical protein
MQIYGMLGILMGLFALIAPNAIPRIWVKLKPNSIGMQYRRPNSTNPLWWRLGGLIAIVIGFLNVFGVITIN